MVMSVASRLPQAASTELGAIARALALGWWLVGQSEAFAVQFADLGEIDLPPSIGSAADQARLQALAPLYLAAELEQARLLPAVEVLAGLYVSGGLQADIGPAGPLLLAFWQNRQQRFATPERTALFSRLFGMASKTTLAARGGANVGFEDAMINLTEALHKLRLDAPLGVSSISETTMRLAVRTLADNLAPRAGGIAVFAARDMLATIQQAVDVLKQPALQQAFGATSFWATVRAIAHTYLDETPSVESHVTRGRAGMLVMTWVAQAMPLLDDTTQLLVEQDHPVLAAATAWLQASLHLEEQRRGLHGQRG
jgi:hypothetical protein